ncbi:MAG TPA: SDR family NAD(P)-dependent oxidoreductase [Longimicrobium sp.]|nr:SDR family NAD(P)-dependent oxidoreductase [Longimicrobium sp.]
MITHRGGTDHLNTFWEIVMQSKLVALVTGANQGIGLQIAKELAAHGYTVLAGSRNPQNGEAAAREIGGDAHAIQLDVTDPASITAAAERVRTGFGRLDLLVNNAAISHAGAPGQTLEEIIQAGRASVVSLNEVRAVWETNVFGVIAVTQALLPLLRQAPAARIVNVSSNVGSLTLNADAAFPYRNVFTPGYAASKTALNAITLAFAIDLEGTNIKVNAVSPGFTATALNNFQGVETIEQGSREPVRVALETDGPTGTFTGPDGLLPW